MKVSFVIAATSVLFSLSATAGVQSKNLGKGSLIEKTFALDPQACMNAMQISHVVRGRQVNYYSSICTVKLDNDPNAVVISSSGGSLSFVSGFGDGTGEVHASVKLSAEGYTVSVSSATKPDHLALHSLVKQALESMNDGKSNVIRIFQPE